jgi:hypothetical protein
MHTKLPVASLPASLSPDVKCPLDAYFNNLWIYTRTSTPPHVFMITSLSTGTRFVSLQEQTLAHCTLCYDIHLHNVRLACGKTVYVGPH